VSPEDGADHVIFMLVDDCAVALTLRGVPGFVVVLPLEPPPPDDPPLLFPSGSPQPDNSIAAIIEINAILTKIRFISILQK
jgi:hypothetical protein